jgi:hypothetical protein
MKLKQTKTERKGRVEKLLDTLLDLFKQAEKAITDYRKEAEKKQIKEEKKSLEPINEMQANEILYLCRDHPDVLQNMLSKLRLKKLGYMPQCEYRKNIERLRSIIDARKNAC